MTTWKEVEAGGAAPPVFINDDYMTVRNVLPDKLLADAQRVSRISRYVEHDMGDGTKLHLAGVPQYIDQRLHNTMELHLGLQVQTIASFYRLNSARHDVSFRIHCDSSIRGRVPTHAAVFYLDDAPGSGTALYSHPTHGDRDSRRVAVYREDDGQWDAYHKCSEVANSMFIYRADLFHGRFPWVARGNTRKDGRVVVVRFVVALP